MVWVAMLTGRCTSRAMRLGAWEWARPVVTHDKQSLENSRQARVCNGTAPSDHWKENQSNLR